MTFTKINKKVDTGPLSYLWLFLGAGLLVFSTGIYNIALLAWLFPVFLMRFVRLQSPLKGFCLCFLGISSGLFFSWENIGKFPIPAIVIMAVTGGLSMAVIFQIDRFVALKYKGLISTLVFPMTWVTRDFLQSFVTNNTWGSLANSQYGNLPLMQVVSVTGLLGLVFLITWFAPVVNHVWQYGFQWQKIKGVIVAFASVLALVFIFGTIRVTWFAPENKVVRVASITNDVVLSQFKDLKKNRRLPSVEKTIEVMETLTSNAMASDPQIIFWQEYGALMAKEDQGRYVDQAVHLAKKHQIYFMPAIGVINLKAKGNSENKAVLIAPSGKIVWEYLKHHLVPGIEAPYFLEGKSGIPTVDTDHGKMAAVICYDLDFPGFIQKAGTSGVDLMLVPSLDWKGITPLHTHMGIFRAVENGFSLVRGTGQGLSMAVDYQGRPLAQLNDFTSDEAVMVSDLPAKGVTTIYNRIGDLFAWICAACFLILAVWSFFLPRLD